MSTGRRGTRPGSHGGAAGDDYGEQRQQHLILFESRIVFTLLRNGMGYSVSRFGGSRC